MSVYVVKRELPGVTPEMLQSAGLRAKISAATAAHLDAAERRDKEAEARRFFATAVAVLEPATPRFVAVGGLSGSGKTTLARALAPGGQLAVQVPANFDQPTHVVAADLVAAATGGSTWPVRSSWQAPARRSGR